VKQQSNVARALANIALSDSGRQSCIDAGATLALTTMMTETHVKMNGDAACNVALALRNIAQSDTGRQCCIDAGAPLALVVLAAEFVLQLGIFSITVPSDVIKALNEFSKSEQGMLDCITAISSFATKTFVKKDCNAVKFVAETFNNFAKSEVGCQACISAGIPLLLTALSRENIVKNDSIATMSVTQSFEALIQSDSSRQACISSLVALTRDTNVMENTDMARNISKALYQISSSEIGLQSCIDSGVPHSFLNRTSKKSSRENDLIWIQGTGAANTGSVLVILAQNGYTREAHQIISLSRIASLIGRDSDGGLPELWDIMGKVRGEGGITRLMAVCATRGSLSPQRARALIKDHNDDLKATDNQGRTALHYALGAQVLDLEWDIFDETPINTDLIRILIEACPDLVKMKDETRQHPLYEKDIERILPLYYACISNVPFDVIKLLIDIYPEGFKDVSLNKLSSSTLVALAKEKAVKENGSAASNVASALYKIALSEAGRQACIDAGATLALVTLSGEKAVKENGNAASNVAYALRNIAFSDTGRQSCIDAGVPLALTNLAKEKAVKENSECSKVCC
jgi:hypothetical protein